MDVQSIALTGGATRGACTPTLAAPPAAGTPLVLDPSVTGSKSITCSVGNPTLDQTHFEAGFVAWEVTVGVVAKGANTSANGGGYTVTFNKTLTQERKYQLGIKRMGSTGAMTAAGEHRYLDADLQICSSKEPRFILCLVCLQRRGFVTVQLPCVTDCIAGTTVTLQTQLVNSGNTILKGVTVAEAALVTLSCKKGLKSDMGDTVWASSGTAASLPVAALDPTQQLVCQGTFLFDQGVLDLEQPVQVFTPTATTTCGATADAAPSGYAASASIDVTPAALLVVNIVTSACTIPSIIADGDSSKCGRC